MYTDRRRAALSPRLTRSPLARVLRRCAATAALVGLVGCGDDGALASDSDGVSASGVSTPGIVTGDASDASASASASAGSDGSASASGSGGTTDDASASASASAGTSTGDDTGIKFDVGLDDMPSEQDPCGGGMGEEGFEFSFIWIANSSQGTVSKIDTMTGVEMGRYYTDPSQGAGSPSRTSVNLLGDVAVSNRNQPSTTKIAAREESCVDSNNNGVIDTSSGPNDVLPWGTDECVLWHTPFPLSPGGSLGPRPTQWAGEADENGCPVANPRLWVGYEDNAQMAHFVRLDGATGQVLDDTTTPWDANVLPSTYGPYGGAVNADGDLYAIGLYTDAPLIRVDFETLEITNFGKPGGVGFYGIAIDGDGNPWIGGHNGVVFFEVPTQQWTVIPTGGTTRGIAVDREGRAWAAADGGCGIVKLDVATRTVLEQLIPLPGCFSPWGVAVDIEGYVWSPDMSSNQAYKVDPDTHQVVHTVTGLVGPYTYSDMTGAGLGLVINPPG